jgi:hypothetical protein
MMRRSASLHERSSRRLCSRTRRPDKLRDPAGAAAAAKAGDRPGPASTGRRTRTACAALLVHEVLGHRRAGVRGDVLQRSGIRRRCRDDDRVVHRAVLAQHSRRAGHGRFLLTDRDIDADHVAVLLVDDRIERDRGLARLAVADDQLTLTRGRSGSSRRSP